MPASRHALVIVPAAVPVAPAALPLALAPPAPDEVEHEDGDYEQYDKRHVVSWRPAGMTGAGIEPAARALKVRCSTTELPGHS